MDFLLDTTFFPDLKVNFVQLVMNNKDQHIKNIASNYNAF